MRHRDKDRWVWGLPTGLSPQGPEASALAKVRKADGSYWNGEWRSWPLTGFLDQGGELLLSGPDLGEAVELGWNLLPQELELARLQSFAAAAGSLSRTLTGPWLSLEKETFLVLPAPVARLFTPESRFAPWDSFASPFSDPVRDRSWRIASLVWRLYTGTFPFPAPTSEEAREQRRRLCPPKAAWVLPHLPPRVHQALDKALNPRLDTWEGNWTELLADLPLEGRSPGERELRLIRRWEKSQKSRLARRQWWRRHKGRVLAWGAVGLIPGFLLAGLVGALIIPAAPDPSLPLEVVQSYYSGFDTIQDKPLREASRGHRDEDLDREANEMARLFVFSQLQVAQMGGPGILSAAQWDAAGRPPLQPYQTLFGITDLVLTPLENDQIRGVYTRWSSTQEDKDGVLQPRVWEVSEVTDLLSLVHTPGGWKIHALQREVRPVPYGGQP